MVATFEQMPVVRIVIRWSMLVAAHKDLRQLQKTISAWERENGIFPAFGSSGGPEIQEGFYLPDEAAKYIEFLRSLGIPETDDPPE